MDDSEREMRCVWMKEKERGLKRQDENEREREVRHIVYVWKRQRRLKRQNENERETDKDRVTNMNKDRVWI